MKRAVILINAYSRLKSSLNQSQRLKAELEKRGVKSDILPNDFFAAAIEGNGIVSRLSGYDFCVYLDKDKYISHMLERAGMRLFNSADAIEKCDDKMTTYIELSGHKIPMPKTLPGLLCYDEGEPVKKSALDIAERELGYPMIVKACYGSLGKGVYKADGRTELEGICAQLKCQPHLFQKYISESRGRDMRVIVVGGRCVAAMVRSSDSDFRSNIELGGHGTAIDPPEEIKDIVLRAAAALGLDYCGADVLFGKDGYLLCEVNSNAFFGGIESVTKVNVGGLYADHMCRQIYEK